MTALLASMCHIMEHCGLKESSLHRNPLLVWNDC